MDAITNFTFQYVSINTSLERAHSRSGTALHSNMFLLIRFAEDKKNHVIYLYIPICFY